MAKGASERAKWLKERVEGFKRVEVRTGLREPKVP